MATYQEKIANAEAEILQLQNRVKKHKQELKKQERKAREHRIFQRGGYIEKVLPETITLSAENFREFIDKTLTTKFSVGILEAMKARQNEQAAAESAATDTASAGNPAASNDSSPPQSVSPIGATQANPRPQGGANASVNPPDAKCNAD
jgi:hypothetical protein